MRTAERLLKEQISLGQTELLYIDSVFDSLVRATSEAELAQIREELESAYEKMTTNDHITAYINAQRTFQAIIDQMNSIISFHITGKIPGGCSGSCSSCGGCH